MLAQFLRDSLLLSLFIFQFLLSTSDDVFTLTESLLRLLLKLLLKLVVLLEYLLLHLRLREL